jgi:hypothetical protein
VYTFKFRNLSQVSRFIDSIFDQYGFGFDQKEDCWSFRISKTSLMKAGTPIFATLYRD